ncbi:decapping and exoribonuclease protein-like [Paramacrobiotus metropolitanus]|uniref:decapping and exoribonuclease protein-like n=1 Tax=Paramacrobiotus metropolitanus TaxID=2943436 RepID=UPI0024465018|nr:decapping and exoribonuclease protein-like [Paramacrobiotus metropolitanus]
MHKICIKSWGQSQSTPGLNRTNISDTVSEIGNFSSNPVLFTHPPILQRRGNVGEVRVRGLNLDLNHGFLPGLEEPQDARKNRHLNILLNWLREHPDDFHNAAPEIICWSSTLKEVMLTAVHVKAPKAAGIGWIIAVCKIDRVLYMALDGYTYPEQYHERLLSEEELAALEFKEELMTYRGRKFEQYMTHPVEMETTLDSPLENRRHFCSFLARRINGINVIFGAEIDCQDPNASGTPAPGKYVEIKTTKLRNSSRKWKYNQYKLSRYWAQACIAGVSKVIIGLWNPKGTCVKIDEFDTAEIPDKAKTNPKTMATWSAEGCIDFLERFLKRVKEIVIEDHTQGIYKFQWSADKKDEITVDFHPGPYHDFIQNVLRSLRRPQ